MCIGELLYSSETGDTDAGQNNRQGDQGGRIRVDMGDQIRSYVCWLPGWEDRTDINDCMDEKSIRKVIQQNSLVMQRYRRALKFESLYHELHDDIKLQDLITLTKLAAIEYWLRRDALTDEDFDAIFEMMLFWERIVRQANFSIVGMAVSLVNYGILSGLVTHISEYDSEILTRYYQIHGRFYDEVIDADYFETVAKHEFRMLNTEFCFITHYADKAVGCEPRPSRLQYKPGRTVKIFYRERLRYEDCFGPDKRTFDNSDGLQFPFWVRVLSRPGNMRGRATAFLLSDKAQNTCEIFKNLRHKMGTNRFRNFYLDLKNKGLEKDQIDSMYRNNRDFFRIDDSDEFYRWDAANGALVYSRFDNKLKDTIPY